MNMAKTTIRLPHACVPVGAKVTIGNDFIVFCEYGMKRLRMTVFDGEGAAIFMRRGADPGDTSAEDIGLDPRAFAAHHQVMTGIYESHLGDRRQRSNCCNCGAPYEPRCSYCGTEH